MNKPLKYVSKHPLVSMQIKITALDKSFITWYIVQQDCIGMLDDTVLFISSVTLQVLMSTTVYVILFNDSSNYLECMTIGIYKVSWLESHHSYLDIVKSPIIFIFELKIPPII